MKFTIALLSVMLTSACAMTLHTRQNGIPTCKKGDISSKFLGPFEASMSSPNDNPHSHW